MLESDAGWVITLFLALYITPFIALGAVIKESSETKMSVGGKIGSFFLNWIGMSIGSGILVFFFPLLMFIGIGAYITILLVEFGKTLV